MDESLRAAFGYPGCPICWKLEKEEFDFMCQLQGSLKEEENRRGLFSSGGFCNFHFHEMARLTSPLVMALVAKTLIGQEIENWDPGRFRLPSGGHCPVCEFLGKREDIFLKETASCLRETAVQREYEKTDGFCLLHLKKILPLLEENGLDSFLFRVRREHLERASKELKEFIEKKGKVPGERSRVKKAWWVAVQQRVGKRGLKISA